MPWYDWLPLLFYVPFVAAVGLSIGSFTNVLIYRLPLGLSLTEPAHSFCPACGTPILWRDNIPAIGFLLLGGHCRTCEAPISIRYPVVEVAVAVLSLALFDAIILSQTRTGLSTSIFVSERLFEDWPILVAHLVLFSCLFALSAIDLEHYWVDIRFTNATIALGVVMHALWTPPASLTSWGRPAPWEAAAATGAALGVLLLGLWDYRRRPVAGREPVFSSAAQERAAPEVESDRSAQGIAQESAGQGRVGKPGGETPGGGKVGLETTAGDDRTDDPQEPSPTASAGSGVDHGLADDQKAQEAAAAPAEAPSRAGDWLIFTALFTLLLGMVGLLSVGWLFKGSSWRVLPLAAAPVLFFLMIVWHSRHSRESDDAIIDMIEEESGRARRRAVIEGVRLLPAILLAIGAAWLVTRSGPWSARWSSWLTFAAFPGMTHAPWHPLLGVCTALQGLIVAGALGWLIRIFFTLMLGREAFGTGDIHLMAAAGCVAGWPVVGLGFFLACFLAMAGWLAVLPFKQTRAVPLGPWLSLAFLVVVLFHKVILSSQLVKGLRLFSEMSGEWLSGIGLSP